MRIEVVTPPETEPIATDDAKGYLRVDVADDDGEIEQLVAAARRHVEELTGRALAPQTLRLVLDRFPLGPTLPLPRPPLVSVESVTYLDVNGEEQTMHPSRYEVIDDSTPGALFAPHGWPVDAGCRPGAVRVTFVCGYGAEGGESLPEQLAVAVKQLVRHWYDQRGTVITGTTLSAIPTTLDTLTASLRFRYRTPA